MPLAAAPSELRGEVLGLVRRQLAAQRWDRRLGRAAAALLVVGVGLNAAISWRSGQPPTNQAATELKPNAITQAAIAVAEATDAETGSANCAAFGRPRRDDVQPTATSRDPNANSVAFATHAGQRKEG